MYKCICAKSWSWSSNFLIGWYGALHKMYFVVDGINLSFLLKLYCRYDYTKPCMINRTWGLNKYYFRWMDMLDFFCNGSATESKYWYNSPSGLPLGILLCSLSVCPSVCLSVSHTSVFRSFLCSLLIYWLKSWYINVSWHNTDHVWVSSRLANFYRSYCPLLKLSFPEFSPQSLEISPWTLVYEFVIT